MAALITDLADAGVSAPTANFLGDQAPYYYFSPLTPYGDDRICSTLHIDPEDTEDWMILFSKQFGIDLPSPEDPVELPVDPSWIEFGLWLDRYRGFKRAH